MNNRKLASFQGQIETVLRMSLADLDLRIKKLFRVLRIRSHLTAADIRKWDGYAPSHLLFVLLNLVFLHINSVHDMMKRSVATFYRARKDTFYRFKNGSWSWRPFYWRFIRHLGTRLNWSKSKQDNCLIIDSSVLAKRGKNMEHVSFVYDHSQGKTVNGYELVTLGLITPTNFYPLDFSYRFSKRRYQQAQQAAELEPTGHVAKRIREAEDLKKPDLAISMLKHAQAKQIPASYLLVDSWFASPKFFKDARGCDLHTVARLKNNKTRYLHKNKWVRLAQLYNARKDTLVEDKKLGCLLSPVRTQCRNGVKGHIVFVKGYKEPEIDTMSGRKKSKQPKWIAIFCTDLKLSAREVVKKYILRWSIEVFFKEAKQRLGLGKEQSRSFAAQLFSTTQAFVRYSILAYLLEQQPSHCTIGDMFHQIEQESGTLTFFERLWDYFCLLLRRCLDTLAQFLNPGAEFRNYIGAICSAVNAFEPLKGCET
jgi:hypothetical protein